VDAKFAAIDKQMQALDSKLANLVNRPVPSAAPAQALNAEVQKLKKDVDLANQKAQAAQAAAQAAQQAQAAQSAKLKAQEAAHAAEASKVKTKEASPAASNPPKTDTSMASVAPPVQAVQPAPIPEKPPAKPKMLVYPRPNDE
jgi:peptidoglycan hydrolase CwlO-like protein